MQMRYFSILLFVVVAVFSCKRQADHSAVADITVSILPQKYLIDRLSDSTIEVNVMVPPGSSPEMFEPTAQLMKNISRSKVLFIIGPLEFEKVLIPRIRELNPRLVIVNHSEGIDLLEDECGHAHHPGEVHSLDPHIWSSPKIFSRMAEQICSELKNLYPEKKEVLEKNLNTLRVDIHKIDSCFNEIGKSHQSDRFIVYHPAYGYLAKDYGLKQLSLEESGKNPSAEKLKSLIDTARYYRISKVFVQAQFDAHFIEALAKEIQAEIVQVDPLAYNWVESNILLIKNLTKL